MNKNCFWNRFNLTTICKAIYLLSFLLCTLFLVIKCAQIKDNRFIQINYQYLRAGNKIQLFWDTGNGNNEAESTTVTKRETTNKNTVQIPFYNTKTMKSFRIDSSNSNEIYSIYSVSLCIDDYLVLKMGDYVLNRYFVPSNYTDAYTGDSCYVIQPDEKSDSYFSTENPLILFAANHMKVMIFLKMFANVGLIYGLILLSYCLVRSLTNNRFLKILLIASSILVFLITIFLGVGSESMKHPDEFDAKAAIDYYTTQWQKPDIRQPELSNSFDGYGTTRLIEHTWYYLIAGKIGAILLKLTAFSGYYRVFNWLLLFMLTLIFIKKTLSEKWWVALVLGISVQQWYIFSYATSDALDFAVSTLLLLFLLKEDSIFNQALSSKKKSGKEFLAIGIVALLCGLLLTAKLNYYIVLMVVLIILFFRWLREENGKKTIRLIPYGMVCVGSILLFALRYLDDFKHYGFERSSVIREMEIKYAAVDRNPSSAMELWSTSMNVRKQGISLLDLVTSQHLISRTFKSFVGLINVELFNWYYILVGVLFVCILGEMAWTIARRKVRYERAELVLLFALIILSLFAVLYRSWTYDIQPQGRYVLPILIIMGYLGYKVPELWKKRYFRAEVLLLNMISVVAYAVLSYGYVWK